MTKRIFNSKPENYRLNILEGLEIHAESAWLNGPDGKEPGVVIRSGYKIQAVITASAAIRLANEIADSVEDLERRDAA